MGTVFKRGAQLIELGEGCTKKLLQKSVPVLCSIYVIKSGGSFQISGESTLVGTG